MLGSLQDIIAYVQTMMPQMMEGLKVTLEVFALTLVLAVPLGVVVALCRLSKMKVLNKMMEIYILIMRGTPLLLHQLRIACPTANRQAVCVR